MKTVVVILAATVLLFGCDKGDATYTLDYQCRFTYNTLFHPKCILNDCINPLVSGTFCFVSQTTKKGILTLELSLNDGKTKAEEEIRTAEETRVPYILGASNGLIIGCSTFNDGKLFAYDRQCPHCLKEYVYHPVQWTSRRNIVKCGRCNSTYNLENYGAPEEGDTRLLLYPANFNGTYLYVGN